MLTDGRSTQSFRLTMAVGPTNSYQSARVRVTSSHPLPGTNTVSREAMGAVTTFRASPWDSRLFPRPSVSP